MSDVAQDPFSDQFFRNVADGLIVGDTAGYVVAVNAAFCRMVGKSEEEILREPWAGLIHEDDLAEAFATFEELKAGRSTNQVELRLQNGSGGWSRLSITTQPDLARGRVYATVRDVSEASREKRMLALHRRALEGLARDEPLEAVLDELARSAEQVIENSRSSIQLRRDDTLFNAAAPTLPREYLDELGDIPIDPHMGACGTAAWRNAPVITSDIATDPLWDGPRNLALHHKLVACWSVPVNGVDGAVLGTLAVYPDTTRAPTGGQLETMQSIARLIAVAVERRRADTELRLMRTAMEHMSAGMVIAGGAEKEGEIVARVVNRAFEELTGWSSADLVGQTLACLDGPLTDGVAVARLREAIAGKYAICENLINYHRDGTPLLLETEIIPVPDGSGGGAEYLIIKRDKSAQQAMEARLAQAQKMEAVGQLAGGVAHDFNNMLTAITGFADLALLDLPEGETRTHVEEIQRAARRSAAMTRQLLAFAGRQVLRQQVLDLSELVRGVQRLAEQLVGGSVRCAIELDPKPLHVLVDPGQLEQVILNLVLNSRDAMQSGGTLTITTTRRHVESSEAGPLGLRVGAYAQLSLRDTGQGMAPEVQSHIFEPFFTTKADHGGTGLGLAAVLGVVQQSGGTIAVDSRLGVGTTMHVYLPLSTLPVHVDAEPTPHAAPAGPATVLLVEDEPMLRSLVGRMLTLAGMTVLAAEDITQVQRILLTHKERIDILITDVVLPGANGKEVAALVTIHHPETPVLFMSGYAEDVVVHHGVVDHGVSFLEKPFTRDELLGRITAILDHT